MALTNQTKMGIGFIPECLITFYTVENIKRLLERQLEHWNEYEHSYEVYYIGFSYNEHIGLTYYEAFSFTKINWIENWDKNYHEDFEDYWFDTMREFERLCDHQLFIQHISTYTKLSDAEKTLRYNERINFCKNIYEKKPYRAYGWHQPAEINNLNANVDKFVLDDYLCENNMRQFVSYVMENNDGIGLHTLRICREHIKFDNPSYYKCLCDVLHAGADAEPIPYDTIVFLCNTIPFMRYATEWKQKKQLLLVNLHECVFETYENGCPVSAVLCDDYIVSRICKFF